MSQSPKSNSNSTPPEVAGISIDEFSSDVPGVTQLLNPALFAKRKKSSEAPEMPAAVSPEKPDLLNDSIEIEIHSSAPTAPQEAPKESQPKAQIETRPEPRTKSPSPHLHLVFSGSNPLFQLIGPGAHAPDLKPWQKSFFKSMNVDLKFLGIQSPFQERQAASDPFLKEAFGAEDSDYLIFIRHPDHPESLHVLFSKETLANQKETLESMLFGRKKEDTGEIKIELAS